MKVINFHIIIIIILIFLMTNLIVNNKYNLLYLNKNNYVFNIKYFKNIFIQLL